MKRLLTLRLSKVTGDLCRHYFDEMSIADPEDFILNSIRNFLLNNEKHLRTGDIEEIDSSTCTTVTVSIPLTIWLGLLLLSAKLQVSISAIVNEALGHSFLLLIESEQAQEEYMFEQVKQATTNTGEHND